MILDCPWCDGDIETGPWRAPAAFQCPHCKMWVEQDGDYVSEDSWAFWLVKADEWDKPIPGGEQ